MKSSSSIWLVGSLIILAVFVRFLPLPANFSPVLAIALFAGSRVSRTWVAFAIPFMALFLSDLVLGWHIVMAFVYVPFFLMVALGIWASSKGALAHIAAGGLGALAFFFISNFGVWLRGGLYPVTFEGLLQCYLMALPFFQNTVLSLVFFGSVLFSAEAVYRRVSERSPLLAP